MQFRFQNSFYREGIDSVIKQTCTLAYASTIDVIDLAVGIIINTIWHYMAVCFDSSVWEITQNKDGI